MNGGKKFEEISIQLRDRVSGHALNIYIDVWHSGLAEKWLGALTHAIDNSLVLEKNFCFMGFANSQRDGTLILDKINHSIDCINRADLGYEISDHFTMDDCMTDDPSAGRAVGRNIVHERFNQLHRYFEDLQGTSGQMSQFYQRATAETRWHIRQLNLLCHEFECWALSWRKQLEAPEWTRPSMLMCWLAAPRFVLEPEDHELFGIHTLNRDLGGVFVGVNKAVGKHHWEVFNDEGRDSRLAELTTTGLRAQTEACADFDIEWGRNPGHFDWQKQTLRDFEHWLRANGFDPEDPELTIGHPQVGQVDLSRSFGSSEYATIWNLLERHFDVERISLGSHSACYDYHWSDPDFAQRQIAVLERSELC